MPNSKKIETVNSISEKMSKSQSAFFTDYKGINVEQINELRTEFYKSGIEYKVVKKTLTKIAAKDAGYENIDDLLVGQMGIAFSYDDPVSPARIITKYVKDNKMNNFKITGCIFEGDIFTEEKVKQVVDLPSRDELLASLLGTLNAPMGNLVGILNAGMSNFVGVLKSLSEVKEK